MPFDFTHREADLRSVDLIEPNLQNLSILLRNRSLWPGWFSWDYRHPEKCAIGLASEFWSSKDFSKMAPWSWVPFTKMCRIFFMGAGTDKNLRDITPRDVANAIDRHLASVA